MRSQQQEILLGGLGAALVIGGGVYYLDKKGKLALHKPSLSCLKRSSGGGLGSPPNVAPQNLPSNVTRRCGTVFYSFGSSTAHPDYIIVGKYVKGKLSHEYYQVKSQDKHFDPAGQWVGGGDCVTSTHAGTTSTTKSSKPPTTTERAATYNWVALGNGAYQAQPGATLTGLSHVTGISVYTLAKYNHLKNMNALTVGEVIHTTQQASATSGSGGSSGGRSASNVSLADCAKLGYHYSTADVTQSLPCVKRIQQRINELPLGWALTIDGRYGPNTRQAVMTFQRHYQLVNNSLVHGEQLGVFGSPSDWQTLINGYATVAGLPGNTPLH